MRTKGFTLIELLVVVAIIGILAAVGVVAYSGYTSAAKENSLTSRQKLATKFLMSEFQKCNHGQEVYLNNSTTFDQCGRILNPGNSERIKNFYVDSSKEISIEKYIIKLLKLIIMVPNLISNV